MTALIACLVVAQAQSPLPAGAPSQLVLPGLKVSVVAHETIGIDVLRSLARPGVTLWLDTTSNTLRDSTLENVARFDQAWVRLRAPLRTVDALPFRRAPKAGGWARSEDLQSLVGKLPGGRQWAVRIEGHLTEAQADVLLKARPALTHWQAPAEIDVFSYSQFKQLPGRKVLALPAGASVPARCGTRETDAPSVEVHVATLLALNNDVFPCGRASRMVVTPSVDVWLIQSLMLRDPSVELVLAAPDDESARAVAALLTRLGNTQRR